MIEMSVENICTLTILVVAIFFVVIFLNMDLKRLITFHIQPLSWPPLVFVI